MESLDQVPDVPFEVFVDLIDHDKAGDGVSRLGKAKGTFPETFVKIKPLELCQDYPFPLWSL